MPHHSKGKREGSVRVVLRLLERLGREVLPPSLAPSKTSLPAVRHSPLFETSDNEITAFKATLTNKS